MYDMRKKSLLLLVALAGVTTSSFISPYGTESIMTHVAAQEIQAQQQVALGGSLSESEIQQTLELLRVNDIADSNITHVDGTLINRYLQDGSTSDTPVYSSVSVEAREAGYGVQVQIITPNNILLVAPQTYQNAAITAGAKDALIKIASVSPVTGEGALTGLYTIYESMGQQLNEQSIQVAQKEIELVNNVQETESLTNEQINTLQANIKQSISNSLQSNSELTEEEVRSVVVEVVQAFKEEYNISISEQAIIELTAWASDFALTETAKDTNTSEQLDASTNSGWTTEQAIDYWEATFLNGVNGNQIIRENYDRSYWSEVSNESSTIVLHLRNAGAGGNYYVFEKSDQVTQITLYSGNATYPDNPTTDYWVNNEDYRIYQEYDYFTGELTEHAGDGSIIEAPEEENEEDDSTDSSESMWSNEKTQALAEFMATWGNSMNQNYTSYQPGATGSMYGPSFPLEVIDILGVNGAYTPAFWSYDGISNGDYAIVASYADYEDVEQLERFPNYYLFAIVNDQPVVLHSQQRQGYPDGLIHFYPTENAELQAGFESIVNQN